jgi:hypothetical protein
MTEKTVINIDDVPLMDRGNGKRFAVNLRRLGIFPPAGIQQTSDVFLY